jgi:hypothetical protein
MLAEQVNNIKFILFQIDREYLDEVIKKWDDQASFEDSAAVLNPLYRPEKTDVLREQGKSLRLLRDFHESLIKCQEAKDKDAAAKISQDKLKSLFW